VVSVINLTRIGYPKWFSRALSLLVN